MAILNFDSQDTIFTNQNSGYVDKLVEMSYVSLLGNSQLVAPHTECMILSEEYKLNHSHILSDRKLWRLNFMTGLIFKLKIRLIDAVIS